MSIVSIYLLFFINSINKRRDLSFKLASTRESFVRKLFSIKFFKSSSTDYCVMLQLHILSSSSLNGLNICVNFETEIIDFIPKEFLRYAIDLKSFKNIKVSRIFEN